MLSDDEKLKIRNECTHKETGNLIACDFAGAIERAVLEKVKRKSTSSIESIQLDFICLMRNISPIAIHFIDGDPVLKYYDKHKALLSEIDQVKIDMAWSVYISVTRRGM